MMIMFCFCGVGSVPFRSFESKEVNTRYESGRVSVEGIDSQLSLVGYAWAVVFLSFCGLPSLEIVSWVS